MNGTPRLRSSFPSTPGSNQKSPEPRGSPNPRDGPKVRSPLPNLPAASRAPAQSSAPLIPVNLIDAPSQRMYTLAVYGLLIIWRLYDWWTLVEEDIHSIGLFMKWAFIDAIFLFGVPLLRIPWLEWSDATILTAFLAHAAINWMLMFRIPVSYGCGISRKLALTANSSPLKDGYSFSRKLYLTRKYPFQKTVFGPQASCITHLLLWASRLSKSCLRGTHTLTILYTLSDC